MKLDSRFYERLASAATKEGIVDASYATVSTPIGKLMIVSTEAGVCRLGFDDERQDEILIDIAARIGPRIVESQRSTKDAADVLSAYLEGEATRLDIPVDMRLVRTPFHRSILDALLKIRRGEVVSYSGLAARVGAPKAVRAAGTACGKNPIPVIVPCHRVVPIGGGVGNYGGGPDIKRWLLELEGALPS